jgi:N utilization substance protein A
VPEIAEGIVEIKGVAREPGSRAKIAVVSHDPDVDPVGACVGMRGSRVQNVVSELRGEKIDIINWTPDIGRFACSALSPAEVTRVYVDNEEQALEIIVPDDQLSLAIGKKGQNVRLAAKLTGWKIDIKSETRAAESELEELRQTESDEAASADDSQASYSRDELYAMAKEHNLAGRSTMTKEELAQRLTELGALEKAAELVTETAEPAEEEEQG